MSTHTLSHDHYRTYGPAGSDENLPAILFAGISTFLSAQVIPPVREALQAADVKAAVLGMPWEGGNSCRPGAGYGPRAIRRATEQYLPYHGEFQVDLFKSLNLADCGDVAVIPGDRERTFERAERCVTEIFASGAFPVVFGGDDSTPIPVTAAISRLVPGKIGYIHIDSHMDMNEDVAGNRFNHGCPVSRTAELPNVDPRNIAVLGINGPLNPKDNRDYADRHGIHVLTIWDIDEIGIEQTIEQVLEVAWKGTEAVILHTDLDVIDQGFTSGVTTPEVGGLTPREVLKLIRAFSRRGVDAYVITECSPVYDQANKAARVAVRLALDALAIRANPDGTGRV